MQLVFRKLLVCVLCSGPRPLSVVRTSVERFFRIIEIRKFYRQSVTFLRDTMCRKVISRILGAGESMSALRNNHCFACAEWEAHTVHVWNYLSYAARSSASRGASCAIILRCLTSTNHSFSIVAINQPFRFRATASHAIDIAVIRSHPPPVFGIIPKYGEH